MEFTDHKWQPSLRGSVCKHSLSKMVAISLPDHVEEVLEDRLRNVLFLGVLEMFGGGLCYLFGQNKLAQFPDPVLRRHAEEGGVKETILLSVDIILTHQTVKKNNNK